MNEQYIIIKNANRHVYVICTFTARALDEEVDEVQKCYISVLLVRLDPVINDRLKKFRNSCVIIYTNPADELLNTLAEQSGLSELLGAPDKEDVITAHLHLLHIQHLLLI